MAHKKGASSSNNGRDSESKRLGVKRFGGQQVKAGAVAFSTRRNRRLVNIVENDAETVEA